MYSTIGNGDDKYGSQCPFILEEQNDLTGTKTLTRVQSARTFTKLRPVSHYRARAPESQVVIRFKRPTTGRPKSAVQPSQKTMLTRQQSQNGSLHQQSQGPASYQQFKNNVKYRNSVTDNIGEFPQNLTNMNLKAKQEVDFTKLHQTLFDIHEQEQQISEAQQYQDDRQFMQTKFSVSDLKKIIKKDQKTLAKSASSQQMMMLIARDDDQYYRRQDKKPRPYEIYNSNSKRYSSSSQKRPKSPILKEVVSLNDMYDDNDPSLKCIRDIVGAQVQMQRKNSIMNYLLDKNSDKQNQQDEAVYDTQQSKNDYRLSSAEPKYQSSHAKIDQGNDPIDSHMHEEINSNTIQSQQSNRLKTLRPQQIQTIRPKYYYAFRGKTIPTSQIKYHHQKNLTERQQDQRKFSMQHLLHQNKLIPIKSASKQGTNHQQSTVNMFDHLQALQSNINSSREPNSRVGERQHHVNYTMESPNSATKSQSQQIIYTHLQMPKGVEIHTRNTNIYQDAKFQVSNVQILNSMTSIGTMSNQDLYNEENKPAVYQYPVNVAVQPTNYVAFVAESFPEPKRKRPISSSINTKANRMRTNQTAAQLIENDEYNVMRQESPVKYKHHKGLMKNSFISQQIKRQGSTFSLLKTAASTQNLLKGGMIHQDSTQEFGIGQEAKEEKQKEISAYLKRIAKLSRDYEKHFQRKPVFKYLQEYKQQKEERIQEANAGYPLTQR